MPPVQQRDSKKTTRTIVIGIIAGLTVIIGGILTLLSLWLGGTFTQVGGRSYSQIVKEFESDTKHAFTQNETAVIGNINVKVLSVERTIREATSSMPLQDVTIVLELTENKKTPTEIAVSGGDWARGILEATLGGRKPSNTEVSTKYLRMDDVKLAPVQVTLQYRYVPPEGSRTLEYSVSYFTRISGLVGTEGMPRKDATYTITLTQ